MANIWKFASCFLVLFLMATGMARGQAGSTTSISGKVSDPQNAVVPGATVVLTNVRTGLARTTETDAQGRYQFVQVPPGTYRVETELSGFKKAFRDNVELLVNTPTTLEIRLELGELTETVEVSSEAVALNTTDATLGNAFREEQVRQLPLEGRNVVSLLSLQPGVTSTGEVSGSRSDQNNVTLDGIDVNDQQTGEAFTSVLPVTLDSVQEFRVTTSNPTATQGRSGGGQVVLVTKGGSNQFHASAYEYHRNTVTTANNFFNNASGLERPDLLRNIFGFSLGGPIVKNRAFFFVNWERRTDRSQQLITRTGLPSQYLREGTLVYEARAGDPRGVPCPDGSGRRCGIITPEMMKRLDPLHLGVNQAVMGLWKNSYPPGNDPSISLDRGLAYTGLRFNAPLTVDRNTYVSRLDLDLTGSGKHMVYGRGNLADFKDLTGAPQLPGQQPSQYTLDNSRGFAAAYNTQVSPRLINELRYGFTRQGIENTGGPGGKLNRFYFRSFDDFTSFNRANGRTLPLHNITDDLTWIRGTHSLNFGFNFRAVSNQRFSDSGYITFNANNGEICCGLGRNFTNQLGTGEFADMPVVQNVNAVARATMALLGMVNVAGGTALYDPRGNVIPAGPQRRHFVFREYEFYVQDSWKAKPNLTVTYGIRYSNADVPYEKNGYQSVTTVPIDAWFANRLNDMNKGIPSNKSPLLTWDLGGKANNGLPYFKRDNNNWAPRVAVAWSPAHDDGILKAIFGGPGKSSIRAGYSLIYDRVGGALTVRLDQSGAVGFSNSFSNGSLAFGFGFPNDGSLFGPAPRFTGLNSLPSLDSMHATVPPGGFPATLPQGGYWFGFAVDRNMVTPYSQSWTLSLERQMGDFTLMAGYIGRVSRHLLQKLDGAQQTNIYDPASNQTWWGVLNSILDHNPDPRSAAPGFFRSLYSQLGNIPYIENMWPGLKDRYVTGSATLNCLRQMDDYYASWGDMLWGWDGPGFGYGKFGVYQQHQQQMINTPIWFSRGMSSYHSLQVSLRKRFSAGVQFDLNYTLSHAIDDGSVIESVGSNTGQIPNAFDARANFGTSDFDIRHNMNANWVTQLPFGKGRKWAAGIPGWLNQFIGGWELSGILRMNSGLPRSLTNGFNFPTNWQMSPYGTQIGPMEPDVRKNVNGVPNLFPDPEKAWESTAFTRPGATGTRNTIRAPGYFGFDLGLFKRFSLPWEGHMLQLRWETFNVTNTPSFRNPSLNPEAPSTFGTFTAVSDPRVMQFALRYEF